MHRIYLLVLLFFSFTYLSAQMRMGWRSIYDTNGRLSRMNYYENGVNYLDSSLFFQYHTDNVIKGIISGEITREQKCKNGSIMLFDETGMLTSFVAKRNGETVFSSICEDISTCNSIWIDKFNVDTHCWEAESMLVENGEMILYNEKSMTGAIFKPVLPIILSKDFILKTSIPKTSNSSRIGIALGWNDPSNYLLFEIQSGENFSVISYENGVLEQIGEPRTPIEKKAEGFNELIIRNSNKNLIFEINQNIEMIIPASTMKGDRIGLLTRSKGKARFDDFVFQYTIPQDNPIISNLWVGKGTGFYISTSGRILTTYDAVSDAKSIRVKGLKDGAVYEVPAKIVSLEEENNLAVLQVTDKSFLSFTQLPYGYTNLKPISESSIFSVGYPNAVSGIITYPDFFQGKVLPSAVSSSTNMLLELSFRYGMIGSPIFDMNTNLIGIVSAKGMELKFTEGIDFYSHSRLIQGFMGRTEKTLDSPLKNVPRKAINKALSEIVVIIESSVFDFDAEDFEENEY